MSQSLIIIYFRIIRGEFAVELIIIVMSQLFREGYIINFSFTQFLRLLLNFFDYFFSRWTFLHVNFKDGNSSRSQSDNGPNRKLHNPSPESSFHRSPKLILPLFAICLPCTVVFPTSFVRATKLAWLATLRGINRDVWTGREAAINPIVAGNVTVVTAALNSIQWMCHRAHGRPH